MTHEQTIWENWDRWDRGSPCQALGALVLWNPFFDLVSVLPETRIE